MVSMRDNRSGDIPSLAGDASFKGGDVLIDFVWAIPVTLNEVIESASSHFMMIEVCLVFDAMMYKYIKKAVIKNRGAFFSQPSILRRVSPPGLVRWQDSAVGGD